MAQSPSFVSRPSTRFGIERRRLLVLAAFSLFAYYVATGHFTLQQRGASSPAVNPIAETSSARVEQAAVSTGDALIADVASSAEAIADAVAETSSAAATRETTAPEVSAAVAEPAAREAAPTTTTISQPALPPAPVAAVAPAVQALTGPVERWQAAGILIETQGQELDDQSLANIDAALSALPAAVRAQLGNPGLGQLHILINTQGRALSGKQPYGGAANYFSTGDGVNELVMYPKQRVSTILHELGHAYNLRRTPGGHYAKVLLDPEMESFMAATGWKVQAPREQIAQSVDHMRLGYEYTGTFRWQGLSKFDPLEDFANSFAMYFTDPAGLRAQSPERHAWMAANLPR